MLTLLLIVACASAGSLAYGCIDTSTGGTAAATAPAAAATPAPSTAGIVLFLCIVLFIGIRSTHSAPQVWAILVTGFVLGGPGFAAYIMGSGSGEQSEADAKLAEETDINGLRTAVNANDYLDTILTNVRTASPAWPAYAQSLGQDLGTYMKLLQDWELISFEDKDYINATVTDRGKRVLD